MLNREGRKKWVKEQKKLGNSVKLPKGYQDSSNPIAYIGYRLKKVKSKKGIKYLKSIKSAKGITYKKDNLVNRLINKI